MDNKEFSKAVNRYLNNGWIINNNNVSQEYGELTIEFIKYESESITVKSILELSFQYGVRIKNTSTNWNYTEWNDLNNLTLCL